MKILYEHGRSQKIRWLTRCSPAPAASLLNRWGSAVVGLTVSNQQVIGAILIVRGELLIRDPRLAWA